METDLADIHEEGSITPADQTPISSELPDYKIGVFDYPDPLKDLTLPPEEENSHELTDLEYVQEYIKELKRKATEKAAKAVEEDAADLEELEEKKDEKPTYLSYLRSLSFLTIKKEEKSRFEKELERLGALTAPEMPVLEGRRIFSLNSFELRNFFPLPAGRNDVIQSLDILGDRRKFNNTRKWYDGLSLRPFRGTHTLEWKKALMDANSLPVSVIETESFVFTQSKRLWRRLLDAKEHIADALRNRSAVSPLRSIRETADEFILHPSHKYIEQEFFTWAHMCPDAILLVDNFTQADEARALFGEDRKICIRYSPVLEISPYTATFLARGGGYSLAIDPLELSHGIPSGSSISLPGEPTKDDPYTLEEALGTMLKDVRIIEVKGNPNSITNFKREITRTAWGQETDLSKSMSAIKSPPFKGVYVVYIDSLNWQYWSLTKDLTLAVQASTFLSDTFGNQTKPATTTR